MRITAEDIHRDTYKAAAHAYWTCEGSMRSVSSKRNHADRAARRAGVSIETILAWDREVTDELGIQEG